MLDDSIIHEMNWKGCEKNGHGLIEILSWPRGSKENHKKKCHNIIITIVPARIPTENLLKTTLEYNEVS